MSLQRLSIRYGTRVLLGGVLLLLLASSIWAAPLQQTCATMGFNRRTASAVPGGVAVLRVPLDANGVTFDVAGFLINFDPTLLQVVDAAGDPATQVESGDLPGINAVNTASNTAGTIQFAQAIVGGHTGGKFNVATIRLKVIAPLPAGDTQATFINGVGNTGVYLAGQPLLCEFPGPATIIWPPPPEPEPVGGYVVPVNKLGLLALRPFDWAQDLLSSGQASWLSLGVVGLLMLRALRALRKGA